MTIAHIDADILVYRVGFTTEDLDIHLAWSRMDESVYNIMTETDVNRFRMYLSSEGQQSFRYKLFPEYKAKRGPKPRWYKELRAHLVSDYNAVIVSDLEADDVLAIYHLATPDSLLCTIDKDLDQIPGKHYDFVKKLFYDVTQKEADKFFYLQLLMGDRVDNIKGVPNIGPVKAERLLIGLTDPKEIEKVIYNEYLKYYKDKEKALSAMVLNGQLLKIKRYEDEPLWQPKELTVEVL